MKPCAHKRKNLALLALDALDATPAQTLRAHLEQCAGCRAYFAEMRQVSRQLAAAPPGADVSPSAGFHREVMTRLRAEAPASLWATMAASVRSRLFTSRIALPVLVILPLLLLLISHLTTGNQSVSPAPIASKPPRPLRISVAITVDDNAETSPTLANYQRVANQSPDRLDELLAQQDNPHPDIPVCTASTTALNF